MANGDDEEDYMSDVFLDQSAQVKPGLLTKSQKRKFKHDTAQKGSKKRKLEDQKRQEGLATPISQGNKGFALLEKMGYKQGSGIGKSGMYAPQNFIPIHSPNVIMALISPWFGQAHIKLF